MFVQPPPPRSGLQESSSPGSGSLQEPRPERGQFKPRGEGVNPAPAPACSLHTIHQEVNRKHFVSIRPQKIQGFPPGRVWAGPRAPLSPGAGAGRVPRWAAPPRAPCHLVPLRTCSGQGSLRAPLSLVHKDLLCAARLGSQELPKTRGQPRGSSRAGQAPPRKTRARCPGQVAACAKALWSMCLVPPRNRKEGRGAAERGRQGSSGASKATGRHLELDPPTPPTGGRPGGF